MSKLEPGRPTLADDALVHLLLSYSPRVEQIGAVCDLLASLYVPHVRDPDASSRLRLVVHELLENLVKYSTASPVEFDFHMAREGAGLRVTIRTQNRAAIDRLTDAEARLTALNAAHDPVAHYDEVIRASAGRREGSGLGLARIHAEGEMLVSHLVVGDRLTILVEGTISPRSSR
ncbi:MAG TPA: hypothetical protein VGM29_13565 [Polyangiaceae bacterium]